MTEKITILLKLFNNFELTLSIISSLFSRSIITKFEIVEEINKILIIFFNNYKVFINSEYLSPKNKKVLRYKFNIIFEKWLKKNHGLFKNNRNYLINSWNSKLLENFYNKPNGNGIGLYIDKFLKNNNLANSIKKRNNIASKLILYQIKNKKTSNNKINVMDVGYGSSKIIITTLTSLETKLLKNCNLTFMEISDQAINRAKNEFLKIGINVELKKKETMLELAKQNDLKESKQDIINAVGLFDFHCDDLAIRAIRTFYKLLKKKGSLFIASFNDEVDLRFEAYWIWGLRLNYRNINEMVALVKVSKLKNSTYKIIYRPNNSIIIIQIIKN